MAFLACAAGDSGRVCQSKTRESGSHSHDLSCDKHMLSLPSLSVHGKKMAVFFALIALLFAFSEAEIGPKPLSDEMVDYINSVQTTWKAGRNFESVGFDIDYVKRLCGVPLDEDGKPVKPKILQGIGCVQLSASQQLMCQLCTYQFVTSTPLRAYHGHLTPSPSPGVGHLTNPPRGWGI